MTAKGAPFPRIYYFNFYGIVMSHLYLIIWEFIHCINGKLIRIRNMIPRLVRIDIFLNRLNILVVIFLVKEALHIFQCFIIKYPGVNQCLNNIFIKSFSSFYKVWIPHFCMWYWSNRSMVYKDSGHRQYPIA